MKQKREKTAGAIGQIYPLIRKETSKIGNIINKNKTLSRANKAEVSLESTQFKQLLRGLTMKMYLLATCFSLTHSSFKIL